jgi:hypothetical protein
MPLQLSTTSQTPAALRQTAELFASAGHAPLDPLQTSTRSQTPAELRQTVPDDDNVSAGQVPTDPLQIS